MKNIKILVVMVLSSLILALSFPAKAAQPPSNTESYLYIQRAKLAKLTVTSKPNVFRLTLRGVDPYVIYFTDRPVRKAGLISISSFYQLWTQNSLNGFKMDAPNAGLSGAQLHQFKDHKDTMISAVFTLSSPVYTPNKRAVTYTATRIGDATQKLPNSIKARNVVLFFDPYSPGGI